MTLEEENKQLRKALELAREEFKAYKTTHYYRWSDSWQDALDNLLYDVIEPALGINTKLQYRDGTIVENENTTTA